MPSVDSSMIREIDYEDEGERLIVVFATGRIYAYEPVPRSLYEALLQAPSKGEYFNAMIRGAFRTIPLRRR